ncbi:MAG: hypothetical protein GF311_28465 [Candidatus Lokiarchaeota archaeon]|nr:hypothetical protein [Candidatus Lokiarchaeota archaeon]
MEDFILEKAKELGLVQDGRSLTIVQARIKKTCDSLGKFLITKNKLYGNSAIQPLEIFRKHKEDGEPALNGILERIDDKLSRIANSETLRKNDIVDNVGYQILICVIKGWDDFTELID